MPIYCYKCPECGSIREVVCRVEDRDDPVMCGCDGDITMHRDFGGELPAPTGTEKGETFWSQSLAIHPEQTAEHRRLFPNVRVREDGCIGFDSAKERERYCKATGFHKVPGKLRRQGTKIST